jgi:F420-non-reducing hydrogenase small subunit
MPKILIHSITGCSGCITSLMASDIFPNLLERVEIIYFPFIYDEENIENCDIALIEGCISQKEQIDTLKEIRSNAKKVISLGTCASYGGILSLSKKVKAEAISEYIKIDGMIPGCPPPSKLLGNNIMRLIENKNVDISMKNLCHNCPFNNLLDNTFDMQIKKIDLSFDNIQNNDKNKCFLRRGILCLGPITREGCDHTCINNGVPCEGCLGPVSKDYTSNLVNLLSMLEISKEIKLDKNIFFRFSKPKI